MELNIIYQEYHWAIRFSWFELVSGANGKMKMMKCTICTNIEGRDELLMPKLNSIKHSTLNKCVITILGIVVKEYYANPINVHVKNQRLYCFTKHECVAIMLVN
jgi:hypothetical protein